MMIFDRWILVAGGYDAAVDGFNQLETQEGNFKNFSHLQLQHFHIHFPGLPQATKDIYNTDGIDQWKIEDDSSTGNAYA